ncbi:unnamed protein product [Mytilus coruscus]|uniref:Ig-like domain-containing protein n=1 Tax=Mytilus coruscus TaxID=42192 RepID=A0A6J8DYV5_MYTCO|nr:unnamed protein product [Mytilus coruscus]
MHCVSDNLCDFVINLVAVFWEINELPITFGGNVTLFCNTTSIRGNKITWMKKSDVIVHHGLVFYKSKFAEYSVNGGSFLTIMNANESDFGVSYTCIADIFSFDLILDLDVLNVSVVPSENDVSISWNLSSRRLLRIYFARIFPIPHCQVFHNETNILKTATTISERDGYFYNVSVSFSSPYQLKLCDGNLDVQWSLNNQTISVGIKSALPACYGYITIKCARLNLDRRVSRVITVFPTCKLFILQS